VFPKIAMVSTLPPTQCGIATFAQSLTAAIMAAGAAVEVIDLPSSTNETADPTSIHRHRGPQDLTVTAHVLNSFDLVILQHEFGIWDGPDGDGIVALLGALAVPVVTVLHTVPATARGGQRRVLQRILDLTDAVVVLSHSSHYRLTREFAVRPGTLRMIAHGAHSLWRLRAGTSSPSVNRITTWGLIGVGKGLEWGIQALALLRERGVECEYVIAGATHPIIKRREGEAYRQSLQALVHDLELTDQVTFTDEYLSAAHLAGLICSSTGFLLPYDSNEQITSGVLVEAIAAGGPVVATRFPHAVELLGTGAGVLVNHRDPVSMADGLEHVLTEDDATRDMRKRSRDLAGQLDWQSVGDEYLHLAVSLWRGHGVDSKPTVADMRAYA